MSSDIIKGIRAGISFLTTLPVTLEKGDFEKFTGRIYIFIIVGVLAGLILGVVSLVIQAFIPPALVPALVIACILLLIGINHIDGLSDMGDGIIAGGEKEKKIAAMKDVHAGAGGVLFIALDLIFLYSAISLFAGFKGIYLFIGLLVAEVCAKVAMTTVATLGKSIHEGMGSMTIKGARVDHYFMGLAMAIIVCMAAISLQLILTGLRSTLDFALFGLAGFLTVAAAIGTGLVILDVADKNFGGVNGDVIGAANEIGRIVAFVVLGTLIWMLW